jgi:hypothetical protein
MYLERQWFHDDHLVNQRVVQHHYTFLPPEPCQEPWPRNALKTCSLAGDGKRAEMARQSNVQQPFLSKKKQLPVRCWLKLAQRRTSFFWPRLHSVGWKISGEDDRECLLEQSVLLCNMAPPLSIMFECPAGRPGRRALKSRHVIRSCVK